MFPERLEKSFQREKVVLETSFFFILEVIKSGDCKNVFESHKFA